jgi:FlaA1/EpsC-like NDP-sugar epimerase
MRPGEKLFEELKFETEETVPTSHPKIFINKLETLEPETVRLGLKRLSELVRDKDENGLRECLHELLPEASLTTASESQSGKRRLVLVAGRGK